jgi:hypothetical protein
MKFISFKTTYNLPSRLHQKMLAVTVEEDTYAADKLVDLSEEILCQLAAMGFAVYLQQPNQKEVFNDFLISLFFSKAHAHNAGPLYRWAANMIKEAEGPEAVLLRPFFWQEENGVKQLNPIIHRLTLLRNAVMHGFFVLPPERNRQEAREIDFILEKINEAGLFEKSFGDFHFLNQVGFSGKWEAENSKSWKKFSNCYALGQLAGRISFEYSDKFTKEEKDFAFQNTTLLPEILNTTQEFLKKRKGALVCWYPPGSSLGASAYRNFVQVVSGENYLPIFYTLNERGATFTSTFLEKEIGNKLFELTQNENARSTPFRFLKNKENHQKANKQLVIVLHDVHVALFNAGHLTSLFNACYESGIPILCTAWHYPYLSRFFNSEIKLEDTTAKVIDELIEFSLFNYLRFKGPSKEKIEEAIEFEKLKSIVGDLYARLQNKETIFARRFADENQLPIEYVHESFSILSPFFKINKEPFVHDEIDKLYGFPKNLEESSLIYLSLGRRDIRLEYQHKVLTHN